MLAFVRDVLRDFRQKIQRAENLEVAPRTPFQIAAGRTGEAAAACLFGTIDDRAVIGQANHTGQTEGAAEDILGQPLQSRRVARREVDAVVDAEAGMPPGSHQIDRFLINLILGQKQSENISLPLCQQAMCVDAGETDKHPVVCESAVGDDGMNVRMKVDQLAEGLDPRNHTGD